MKIHKCSVYDERCCAVVSWHMYRADALRAQNKAQKARGRVSEFDVISTVILLPDKADIVEWLNANYTRENG